MGSGFQVMSYVLTPSLFACFLVAYPRLILHIHSVRPQKHNPLSSCCIPFLVFPCFLLPLDWFDCLLIRRQCGVHFGKILLISCFPQHLVLEQLLNRVSRLEFPSTLLQILLDLAVSSDLASLFTTKIHYY